MPDRFTEVTTKSWGSRVMSSFMGVVIGFVMFIVSFGVLYWNEGRVDMSKIAEKATEITSTTVAPVTSDKQLISSTGVLKSEEKIGDNYLKEGDYISIKRNVEMYAWEEEKKDKTKTNVGGSETTETTYTYKKEWTSSPEDSADFRISEGHTNPPMALDENTVSVKNAELGIYSVDMSQVKLPEYRDIKLNNDNVVLADDLKLANEQYLFKGTGTIGSPVIGDTRVSYSVIQNPLDNATIFGKLDLANKVITPFYGEKNSELYRIFEGSRDTAISTMKTEYTMWLWIFRGIGFVLMWLGLMSLFGPISVFLDVLPILGSIGRAGVAFITFFVSLVLSVVTILVSMVIHNLIALVIVILALIAGAIWYLKSKRNK